jgi:hypothetical protein
MMELSFPIISKEKIFKRVDFRFIDKITSEIISRRDGVFFSSNMLGKIVEEKQNKELTEEFLFRNSEFGTSTLLIFYFFEAQTTMMMPLLKNAQNMGQSIERFEKKLKKMNPSDFRYKIIESRLNTIKSAFMSFRPVFDNKIQQQNINKFYYKLLEYMINQHQ